MATGKVLEFKESADHSIHLATKIPRAIMRELRIYATEQERPIKDIVTEALTEHLNRTRRK